MSEHHAWQPRFTLDLRTSTPKKLSDLVDDFERWRRANPATGPLELANGWHDITPQMAEELLKRNAKNRKVVHAQVLYYAGQMQRADWIKTGQPLIFDTEGDLDDGQHRLWAGYLSLTTFPTYVVSDVQPVPNLFAYIDNGRVRSMADALATQGHNGLSGLMTKMLKLVEQYDAEAFSTFGKVRKLPKMSPMDMLNFANTHPRLDEAAHYVASDGEAAAKVIAHKDVAGFMALKILELYDEAKLAEFFGDIATQDQTPAPNDAVTAFQDIMRKDREKKNERFTSTVVLGLLIRVFNAWLTQDPMKKLGYRVTDQFPRIVERQPDEVTAEAAE
jgi:hypothetical protein